MTAISKVLLSARVHRMGVIALVRLVSVAAALIVSATDVLAGAGAESKFRWPSRTIHYAICDCSTGDPKPLCTRVQCVSDVAAVRKAVEDWNDKAGTAVKLVERDPADKKNSYLLYVSQVSETAKATSEEDTWCFTGGVGYDGSNGPKLVVIGDRCVTQQKKANKLHGSILHETGHAVGLRHEQQRTDRDKYLIVKFTGSTANTAIYQSGRMCASGEQAKCEFQSVIITRLYSYGQDLSEYDFGSVMHYPLNPSEPSPWAWRKTCEEGHEDDLKTACLGLAKDGFDRLEAQNLKVHDIGQRKGLSPIDVKALDQLYQGLSF